MQHQASPAVACPSCQTLGRCANAFSSLGLQSRCLLRRLAPTPRRAVRLRGRRTYRFPRKALRCALSAVRPAKESPRGCRPATRNTLALRRFAWSSNAAQAQFLPGHINVGSNAVHCPFSANAWLLRRGTGVQRPVIAMACSPLRTSATQGRARAKASPFLARPNLPLHRTSNSYAVGRR